MFLLAKLCAAREVKGEIDLMGYDGETLAVHRGADADCARGSNGAAGVECDR